MGPAEPVGGTCVLPYCGDRGHHITAVTRPTTKVGGWTPLKRSIMW